MKKERPAPYHKATPKQADHPPISNGLDYVQTEPLTPQVDARLTDGHKQSAVEEHQWPGTVKPHRSPNGA
jgi:hypothetical protein